MHGLALLETPSCLVFERPDTKNKEGVDVLEIKLLRFEGTPKQDLSCRFQRSLYLTVSVLSPKYSIFRASRRRMLATYASSFLCVGTNSRFAVVD